jgi:hypothetical protein
MSLLAAALVLLAAEPNQRRGVIRGIVRGPGGVPLPGARVVAETAPGEDSDGRMSVRGPEAPYVIGEEYVAFLHWSPERQRFISSAAPNAMVPVRGSRIVWRGKDKEGVRDGMPLASFLDRLRELRD